MSNELPTKRLETGRLSGGEERGAIRARRRIPGRGREIFRREAGGSACWTRFARCGYPPAMRRTRRRYLLAQWILRTLARTLYGFQVRGTEHVPLEGPLLVAANHKSDMDPPFLGAGLPREVCYFAKKELFRVPLFSSLIRTYGAIPVDRGGFDRRGIESALAVLSGGRGLLVFPEGTRIRRPGLAEPKEGIGLLAVKSGAPIVPVFIQSTWEPKRSLFRRIPIRIHIGPPLTLPEPGPGELPRERYGIIARLVMAEIRRLGEEAGALPPA
jgi:1-acyl-sn-glycerol-3-phosphate acyltransferase